MGARLRMTPTTRTLAYLEARGWLADVAERRQGPITRDLFGCFDVVAVHPRGAVLFVQVTSASNFASRLAKVKAQPTTEALVLAGVGVEVWGWSDKADPRIASIGPGGGNETRATEGTPGPSGGQRREGPRLAFEGSFRGVGNG